MLKVDILIVSHLVKNNQQPAIKKNTAITGPPAIFLNVNRAMARVVIPEILFLEGLKDYVRIFTREKNYVTRMSMTEMERLLSDKGIVRIHKSFMVNIHQMDAYSTVSVFMGKKEIPIGRQYRHVLKTIQGVD